MKINMIGGRGVMGIVHKKIFEECSHEVIVTGRGSKVSFKDAAKDCDVTIISVPIENMSSVIKEVAPVCNGALMDFCGLKEFVIKDMLEYTSKKVEVCGLHPLYGDMRSISGETVIVCKTARTGKICEEVISCFKKSGAKIKEMDASRHDFLVSGISQNARVKLLEIYSELLERNDISFEELYSFSPPPTRKLIDMISKQETDSNKELYRQMRDNNRFTEEIENDLKELLDKK